MELQYMESKGYGLSLFEPPATHNELPINATEEFKKEFLDTWKAAYKAEVEAGGNSGINIICVLEKLFELLAEEKAEGKDFDNDYKFAAKLLMNSL